MTGARPDTDPAPVARPDGQPEWGDGEARPRHGGLRLFEPLVEAGRRHRAASIARPDGKVLRGLMSEAVCPNGRHRIILSGFGKTTRHSAFLALGGEDAGDTVWRFDFANHVGLSDGEMFDATIGSAVTDIHTICSGIDRAMSGERADLIASSLAARAALRALAEGAPAARAVLVLPVTDIRATIRAAVGRDMIAEALAGRIQRDDPVDIMGFPMSGAFVLEALDSQVTTLASSRDDLVRTPAPVTCIAARSDAWIDPQDVASAVDADSTRHRLVLLDQCDHDTFSFAFLRELGEAIEQALGRADASATDMPPPTVSRMMAALARDRRVFKSAFNTG